MSQDLDSNRYRRQIAFGKIGEAGQLKIEAARVAIIGVGALGSMVAERLTRAGIGSLRLIDRDWVEQDNLPRQTLFTERDAIDSRPKAIAAAEALAAINSTIKLEPQVIDFTPENAIKNLSDIDLIVDGTDNFETRYLLNDCSLKLNLPWVHGGVLGGSGQVMTIVPHQTCCLRCILPDPPDPTSLETCNTAGVLGASVAIVAAWQAVAAIRLIVEGSHSISSQWITIETWNAEVRRFNAEPATMRPSCKACGDAGKLDFLEGKFSKQASVLCGRNAVQISPNDSSKIDLAKLTKQHLKENVVSNAYFFRLSIEPHQINVFADGRIIVRGTEEPSIARSLIAKWIGA